MWDDTMQLGKVKQVIELLVEKGKLTPEQQGEVIAELKSGNKKFAGDIAVDKGFISAQEKDAVLAEQVSRKAEAAVKDMQTIEAAGQGFAADEIPPFIRANWGNNGVVKASDNPSKLDGIAAAANMAQNLVVIANKRPDLAKELIPAVAAAAALARGMSGDDPKTAPIGNASQYMEQLEQGIRTAVAKSGTDLTSNWKDQNITVDEYLAERMKEVQAGVIIALQEKVTQSRAQTR